ncbi:hypothetical protein VTH06DRAFT_3256 [Thermothelomyces fergusii]
MSDEVSDFLRSIELLKERREEEDEARSRELEQRILQEKKERQARRAERARSISPQKSSPANTPPPTAHRISLLSSASDGKHFESPGLENTGSPRQRSLEQPSDVMDKPAAGHADSPTKENDTPLDAEAKRASMPINSPSIGMPSARSPLSWQRRPTSQASDRPRSRPLSVVATENAARNSPGSADSPEPILSRDQIALSLSTKDPSWFRQTADPGRGSGAFRKTQVEDQDTVVLPSTRTQLPGMAQELTSESPKEPPAGRPVTPTNLLSKPGSPLSLSGTQRLDPPAGGSAENAEMTSQDSQSVTSPRGRTSPTRPVSPTKGTGGFVQSAMMRRSDSVKRWSVNSPAGLHRTDAIPSTASTTDSAHHPTTPLASTRPKSMLWETSTLSSLQPASGEERDAQDEKQEKDEKEDTKEKVEKEDRKEKEEKEDKKEKDEKEAGSEEQPSTPIETKTRDGEEKASPSISPSKTMDPRRWSPTKGSSWLEAALKKPESPKTKQATPAPAQPAWMVELNKAKAQKASADLARSSSSSKKPEVRTGGLMRSTPMGGDVKPSALSGFPAAPPVPTSDKPLIASLRGSLRKTSPSTEGPEESHDTSSVKDFRANLKPRAPPPEPKPESPVDELKNIVGSLRRTKTQSYVAQDELKDNILRGKAALNLTGGPKKTELRDEFKEAILKKKEDFKKAQEEGRGVTREPSSASDQSVPEGIAIAKKLERQRTGTVSKHTPTTSTASSDFSHAEASKEPAADSSKPADAPSRPGSRVSGLAGRFNPALAGLLARGPPPASGPKSSGTAGASGTSETSEPVGPGPQLTHLTKNRARGPKRRAPTSIAPQSAAPIEPSVGAASEPNTASLSSAPEPEGAMPSHPAEAQEEAQEPVTSPEAGQAITSSEPRKLAILSKPESSAPSTPAPVTLAERRKSFIQNRTVSSAEGTSLESPKRILKEEPKALGQSVPSPEPSPVKTRARSPTKVHEQVAALAALSQQSPKPAETSAGTASQPPSPKKLDMKRVSRFLEEQKQPNSDAEPVRSRPSSPIKDRSNSVSSRPVSLVRERAESITGGPVSLVRNHSESLRSRSSSPVKDRFPGLEIPTLRNRAETEQSESGGPASLVRNRSESLRSRSSSPVKDRFPGLETPTLSNRAETELPESRTAVLSRGSTTPSGSTGLGLGQAQPTAAPAQAVQKPAETELPQPSAPLTSRPLPAIPTATSPPATTPRVASPVRSPSKQAADASELINNFFGPDRPKRKYTADAAEILMNQPASTARVQTQRAQLIQITSEGKKIPVPSHYERVLFEGEMYVCPHSYLDVSGRQVHEVYFWVGDEVPESQANDAKLFAAREARAFNGKLVKLTQGRETSEFLQALGGIIIIRRGSSNKHDSLAPHMLCGRRYLGQVVFDEVDFSPLSLCSGFPYLISQQGKCYLWKGKGSDVEELGCSRLVGMDLVLTGELVEIEEGSEPDSFWDLLGGGTRPFSADHWRLKPSYDKYRSRLFCASAADKRQITEISPFSQRDLLPSNIYVLDAFFELYIIVGARSQHQYAAFRNALDFAQEYAILAAGAEDRPFVPVSTIVLEGIPRDLKSVFRKWRDANSPTIMHPSSPPPAPQPDLGGAGPSSSSAAGGQPAPSPLKRGRSLRIVPLTQALRALAE